MTKKYNFLLEEFELIDDNNQPVLWDLMEVYFCAFFVPKWIVDSYYLGTWINTTSFIDYWFENNEEWATENNIRYKEWKATGQ